jgi:P63C domain
MSDDYQRRGGHARAEKLPPERRIEIARLGGLSGRAREGVPQALYEGPLHIGGAVIPSAVLDTPNHQRVLTQSGVMTSLGRARQAKGRQYYDGDVNLPAFLTAKNLKPFIPNELYVTSSQIEFRTKRGAKAFGYPAELLPKVCRVFVNADNAGKLTEGQKHVAARARIMLDGLADVGIIGLVDEATGYQEKRANDELQAILAAYISPSLLPWTERFPKDFFQEMFRVWGWPWPVRSGAYPGPLCPRYAGKIIRQVVYGNLPPGVLEELDKLNPADKEWQRRNRGTQLLTEGIGHPYVEKLVAIMTTLFRISKNKHEFWRHYTSAFPKAGNQLVLLEHDD